jgi:hypothetical protein
MRQIQGQIVIAISLYARPDEIRTLNARLAQVRAEYEKAKKKESDQREI